MLEKEGVFLQVLFYPTQVWNYETMAAVASPNSLDMMRVIGLTLLEDDYLAAFDTLFN